MRKGITPVIAVVLLLMITVALIGFAFTYFTDMWQSVAGQGESNILTTQQIMMMTVGIDNIDTINNNIYIRNTGNLDAPFSMIYIYVDNDARSCSIWDPDVGIIVQGKVTKCTVSGGFNSGQVIKLSSPGTSNYNDVAP